MASPAKVKGQDHRQRTDSILLHRNIPGKHYRGQSGQVGDESADVAGHQRWFNELLLNPRQLPGSCLKFQEFVSLGWPSQGYARLQKGHANSTKFIPDGTNFRSTA